MSFGKGLTIDAPPPRAGSTAGDDAVEALLIRHLGQLRAYIRLRSPKAVRDRESCTDLAQSVCREVLDKLDRDRFEYRGEAAFRSWLFELAHNKVRDRMRRHRAQKRDVGREIRDADVGGRDRSLGLCYASLVSPSRVAIGRETIELLEAAFEKLPDDQREAVVLARVVGLSREEIGEKLGRSEDSVRGLLQRGFQRLGWIMSRHRALGDE